jgi:hypothetical protein
MSFSALRGDFPGFPMKRALFLANRDLRFDFRRG